MDLAGEHQSDIEQDIYKVPLTAQGEPMAVLRGTPEPLWPCRRHPGRAEPRASARLWIPIAFRWRRTVAGTESTTTEVQEVATPLPENYCGSCYGAESQPRECCNSCAAVRPETIRFLVHTRAFAAHAG